MTLKETFSEMSETYKVIYADSCKNTEKGSVLQRILNGTPFNRTGLAKTEKDIFSEAERGGRGLGKKRISSWIEKVQECRNYDELATLDPKIRDKKNAHDIWKHCSSIHKGEKQNSCWEFDIGGYCRIMCFIDHTTKQILVMDGSFTEADHASKVMYQRLSDLADEIFERTNQTQIFEQIKQDTQTLDYVQIAAKEITSPKSNGYIFGEDGIDSYVKALKNLRKIEQETSRTLDAERKNAAKELSDTMKLLYDEDKNAFNQLFQDVANIQKQENRKASYSSKNILDTLSEKELNQVYSAMQNISNPVILEQQHSY